MESHAPGKPKGAVPVAEVPGSAAASAPGPIVKSLRHMAPDLLFPGDSEMAARCRAFDWEKTKLGPTDTWPACLRVAVGIVLTSRNPMFLFWGPHFVQLSNDAYAPSLGRDRHPGALGAEGPAFWTDIWSTIGPEIEGVMATGEPTWHEDQFIPIERNGKLDDVWWTYGYSPVHSADGTVEGTLVVCQETTQRMITERESQTLVASLATERARLSAIFENAPAFLAVLRGPELVFEKVNPAYFQLVGHRELIGKSVADALPELAGQGFIERLHEVRETGIPFVGKQLPVALQRTPGAPLETRYANFVYQRLADLDGGVLLAAHGVDVTDEVLATRKLERSEHRLREQFAKLPVPTLLWEVAGEDFVLLDFNESAARMDPVFTAGAIGKLSLDLIPGYEVMRAEFRRCLRENVVIRRSSAAGTDNAEGVRTIDFTIGPQQPDRVLVHAVDTTERLELEERLRQAQHMETVGRLAGGVAHDFNNLLTVIGARSGFLLESLALGDPQREDAAEIQKAGLRAAGLTRQLLAFSRQQILKPTPIALNAVVGESREKLRRLLGAGIQVVTDLEKDLGTVLADATQIEQILINLAANARDAMPAGGHLTVTTRNVVVTEEMARLKRDLPAGSYVMLEVKDDGTGMDAASLARLFEPFFTTKGVGEGTGLGLATVYGIVKQSGGFIFADSAPEKGSTFCIYLPEVASEEAPAPLRAVERSSVGAETVLLVEDETAVRDIVRKVLSRQGYHVLQAGNGSEALAVSSAHAGTIHLVVTDAVMPGMGGDEVVRQIRGQRPDIKVLVMSGYTDDEVIRRGIITADVPFIQKPFVLTDFARAVRSALDG